MVRHSRQHSTRDGDDFWPNELFLKLEDPAKDWYNTTFTTKGLRPTWTLLSSGLQRLFGHRSYTDCPTWRKLGAATRLANESGPEALQPERIQTLLRVSGPATADSLLDGPGGKETT